LDCFSDDFLAAYLERTVSARELLEAEAHLGACRDCSAHLAAFARLAAARDSEATRRDPVTAVEGPSAPDELADALSGRVIAGRYSIEGRLGNGGMGMVYRAHDQLMDRRVAIKVIAPRFSHNRQAEPRFLRECRLAARMSHLNAVMVLDHGRLDEGQLYLAMELLIGRTLQEHLQGGPLGEPRALHIASQICDALDAAHRLQIIHRDLKPGNIMLLDDPPGRDFVKVLDFGIARSLVADGVDLTSTDVVIGTPDFTAPEVIGGRGEDVDQRADIYSLGVVLYWMLAGRAPFPVTGDPLGPSGLARLERVRPEVAALVEEMVAIDPARRPSTAAEVRARLDQLQVAPIGTPPPVEPHGSFPPLPSLIETLSTEIVPPAWTPPVATGERRSYAVPLLLVALLAAALGVFLFVLNRPPGRAQRPAAPPSVEVTTVQPTPVAPPPVIAAEPRPAPPAVVPDAGPAIDPPPAPPRTSGGTKRSKPIPSRRSRPPAKKPETRPEYFRP